MIVCLEVVCCLVLIVIFLVLVLFKLILVEIYVWEELVKLILFLFVFLGDNVLYNMLIKILLGKVWV